MKSQDKTQLPIHLARIYDAILAIMQDRKSTSTSISTSLISRTAKFGLKRIEEAQTEFHRLGLLHVELDIWNEAEPKQSRFRYSLPDGKN